MARIEKIKIGSRADCKVFVGILGDTVNPIGGIRGGGREPFLGHVARLDAQHRKQAGALKRGCVDVGRQPYASQSTIVAVAVVEKYHDNLRVSLVEGMLRAVGGRVVEVLHCRPYAGIVHDAHM